MTILTKNTDKLREEVAAHVAADSIVQGIYWDAENERGCFIGCLGRSKDPTINEVTYGLPVMVQRIAENIFEALPANEAKAFFAALPDAVGCDGKDLTRVGWQFLAAELRSLPEQPAEIQAVIDPVIAGMDKLASGQEWPAELAESARGAAGDAGDAGDAAAWWAAAAAAAAAAAGASGASAVDVVRAAAWAAEASAGASAARAAARAAAASAGAAVRLRQRDLLLRLISDAPVVENPMADTDQVLDLAAIIREVDGNHSKGAAALAESILDHPKFRDVLARWGNPAPPPADGEVAELVETLKGIAYWRLHGTDKPTPFDIRQAARLTRAADLLQRQVLVPVAVSDALIKAECALSDIAEGEPMTDEGDPLKWAERRCADTLAIIRPTMMQHKIRTSEWPPVAATAKPLPEVDE